MAGGQGVLLIGAHLGSFEVMRAVGRQHTDHAVSMLMYEENARKINATLAAINPAATQDIIALGRMDSMLQARERLDAGHLVGMLADRGLGDDPTRDLRFPRRAGAVPGRALPRRRHAAAAGVLHDRPLPRRQPLPHPLRTAGRFLRTSNAASATPPSPPPSRPTPTRLEHYCRLAPYNWFNFFDFWRSSNDETSAR